MPPVVAILPKIIPYISEYEFALITGVARSGNLEPFTNGGFLKGGLVRCIEPILRGLALEQNMQAIEQLYPVAEYPLCAASEEAQDYAFKRYSNILTGLAEGGHAALVNETLVEAKENYGLNNKSATRPYSLNRYLHLINDTMLGFAKRHQVDKINELLNLGGSHYAAAQAHAFYGNVEAVNQLLTIKNLTPLAMYEPKPKWYEFWRATHKSLNFEQTIAAGYKEGGAFDTPARARVTLAATPPEYRHAIAKAVREISPRLPYNVMDCIPGLKGFNPEFFTSAPQRSAASAATPQKVTPSYD